MIGLRLHIRRWLLGIGRLFLLAIIVKVTERAESHGAFARLPVLANVSRMEETALETLLLSNAGPGITELLTHREVPLVAVLVHAVVAKPRLANLRWVRKGTSTLLARASRVALPYWTDPLGGDNRMQERAIVAVGAAACLELVALLGRMEESASRCLVGTRSRRLE